MIQTSGELRRENVDSCLSTVIASETKIPWGVDSDRV